MSKFVLSDYERSRVLTDPNLEKRLWTALNKGQPVFEGKDKIILRQAAVSLRVKKILSEKQKSCVPDILVKVENRLREREELERNIQLLEDTLDSAEELASQLGVQLDWNITV